VPSMASSVARNSSFSRRSAASSGLVAHAV
jgi:hypothetical protein